MKQYKAIFFDWDGTAVQSRKAPVDTVVPLMEKLLEQGIILVVVSGTTMENIAGGKIYDHFSPKAAENLYFGLGRGAYHYGYRNGAPIMLCDRTPEKKELVKIHDLTYALRRKLFLDYGMNTEIVFTRPNYCKLDLLANYDRKEALFRQNHEVIMVEDYLKEHGVGSLLDAIKTGEKLAEEMGIEVEITTDAKYLEIGTTTKSDNVDYFLKQVLEPMGIAASDCAFWGDEFSQVGQGIRGSDAYMITELSKQGDFFDVNPEKLSLPEEVTYVGGGVEGFLNFLREAAEK